MTAAVRVTPVGVPVRLGEENTVKLWRALIVLGTARFLMGLDTSVMNVSISQLVEDFDAILAAGGITLTAFLITPRLPSGRTDRA
ncbi:hypothetical protein [Streptomyces europaeiscabiei]|uniref:hypothetical protein n=1 Tax=Streptomyces europaeiscabiei TaxID=146819 RepID=UPI0038F7CAE9